MADKRSLVVYHDILEQLEDFNDEQVGKMFRAMVEYDKSGTIPDFTGEMKIAFKFIKLSLDKNREEYLAKCAKNSESAKKRWEKDSASGCERIRTHANDADNDNDNDNDNDLKKKKVEKKKVEKFVKPTIAEVDAYCKERNNGIDAESFVAFYESKGWLIGKNPMKNWKSAVITWEKSRKNNGNVKASSDFSQRTYTNEQMNELFDDIDSIQI